MNRTEASHLQSRDKLRVAVQKPHSIQIVLFWFKLAKQGEHNAVVLDFNTKW